MDWHEHKKIAAVILHRKLDLMEVNAKFALDHPNYSVDSGPMIMWREDMAGVLNNIINHLKEVVAKKLKSHPC